MNYLLGVDIGTTEVKGTLAFIDKSVVWNYTIEHSVLMPKQDWAEQNPEVDWWGDFIKVVRGLLNKSKVNPANIIAIGISGSYPDFCPVSKDGEPLRNAILYSDNRCIEEVKYLRDSFDLDLTPEEILPKLLWFKKHEPDKFQKTRMVLSSHNYVTYKLTNTYLIDYLSATSLYGLDDELLRRKIGISKDVFPPAYNPANIAGTVTEGAAKETGLKKGTPVIVGTADSFAGMIGIGAIDKNDCMINYGTAGFVVILNRALEDLMKGKFKKSEEIFSLPTYILTVGELLKWFRGNFYRNEKSKSKGNIYKLLDRRAEEVSPGSNGLIVIPYFRGKRVPVFNPTAIGIAYGLSIYHSKTHLYRAILESWGYAIRQGLEKTLKNRTINRVIATGGGAKSKIWRQIVSDIINKPQEYIESDTSLADAFLAGYGIGKFKKLSEIKNWINVSDITHPNINNSLLYDKYYKTYLDVESRFY